MGLIQLIVALALIGFCLWLVLTYIPMPEPFKQGIVVLVVIVIILWVVSLFVGGFPNIRIGEIQPPGEGSPWLRATGIRSALFLVR